MVKEIVTFSDIKVEKQKFHHCEYLILFGYLDIKKYRCLIWFFQAKKIIINTLLAANMMIKKLNHYS